MANRAARCAGRAAEADTGSLASSDVHRSGPSWAATRCTSTPLATAAASMIEADVVPLDPDRFEGILGPDRWEQFATALDEGQATVANRTLWQVNSTIAGGGVAELLMSAMGYLSGAGIASRWVAIEGDEEFFTVTKRIHHRLHGEHGDDGALGPAERRTYTAVLEREAAALGALVRPGDVVILHDPQTAGLARSLRRRHVPVIWTCHVGTDTPNAHAREAWGFLLPFVHDCDVATFSRHQYVWEGLAHDRVALVPPCIDAFSPKNQDLRAERVNAILAAAAIIEAPGAVASAGDAAFRRWDGRAGSVTTRAAVFEDESIPPAAPIVTQVSRWDPLKDHAGVARAFATAVPPALGAHLVLAGPAPDAVADDPEQAATLAELRAVVRSLDAAVAARVHIACLPMGDAEENAAIVNALQRRSDVVVQKSLAEGFGLTVTEALWKERPVVASAVGGIQDQITDGVSGLLVDDPEDLEAFGRAVADLLDDRAEAGRLGRNGAVAVIEDFLAPSYLRRYLAIIGSLLDGGGR
jgi:trehalose synthase